MIAAGAVRRTASVSDYVSVRDHQSQHLLKGAKILRRIVIIPDTALEVCRLWRALHQKSLGIRATGVDLLETPNV